jgi:hypothetical protein
MSDRGKQMTLNSFDEAVLRFGSDLASWPDSERQGAEALLAESAEARTLLAEEQAVQSNLTAALAVDIQAAALVARVQQSVAERRRRGPAARIRFLLPMLAGGAAAALACGVALGLLLPVTPGLNPDALLVTLLGGGFI